MQTRLARAAAMVAVMVIMLMGAARAEAQTWGVKGGVNWIDVSWGDTVVLDTPYTFGIVGGAFIRLKPMKAISLQVEGLLSQVAIDYSSGESSVKDTVTYAEVPVLWQFGRFGGSSTNINLLGGAAFDFRLYGQQDVNDVTEKINDAFAPWAVSLVGGADVDWGAHWVFGARYIFGLTDIYNSVIAVDVPAKQRGFQFTAGWRF